MEGRLPSLDNSTSRTPRKGEVVNDLVSNTYDGVVSPPSYRRVLPQGVSPTPSTVHPALSAGYASRLSRDPALMSASSALSSAAASAAVEAGGSPTRRASSSSASSFRSDPVVRAATDAAVGAAAAAATALMRAEAATAAMRAASPTPAQRLPNLNSLPGPGEASGAGAGVESLPTPAAAVAAPSNPLSPMTSPALPFASSPAPSIPLPDRRRSSAPALSSSAAATSTMAGGGVHTEGPTGSIPRTSTLHPAPLPSTLPPPLGSTTTSAGAVALATPTPNFPTSASSSVPPYSAASASFSSAALAGLASLGSHATPPTLKREAPTSVTQATTAAYGQALAGHRAEDARVEKEWEGRQELQRLQMDALVAAEKRRGVDEAAAKGAAAAAAGPPSLPPPTSWQAVSAPPSALNRPVGGGYTSDSDSAVLGDSEGEGGNRGVGVGGRGKGGNTSTAEAVAYADPSILTLSPSGSNAAAGAAPRVRRPSIPLVKPAELNPVSPVAVLQAAQSPERPAGPRPPANKLVSPPSDPLQVLAAAGVTPTSSATPTPRPDEEHLLPLAKEFQPPCPVDILSTAAGAARPPGPRPPSNRAIAPPPSAAHVLQAAGIGSASPVSIPRVRRASKLGALSPKSPKATAATSAVVVSPMSQPTSPSSSSTTLPLPSDLPVYLQHQFIEALGRGPVTVSLPGLGVSTISLPMLVAFSPSMLQALGDCAEPRFGPSPRQIRAAAAGKLEALARQERVLKAEVAGKEVERAAKRVKDLREAAARAALAGSPAIAALESQKADEAERVALKELEALRASVAAMEAERVSLALEMESVEREARAKGKGAIQDALERIQRDTAVLIAEEERALEAAKAEALVAQERGKRETDEKIRAAAEAAAAAAAAEAVAQAEAEAEDARVAEEKRAAQESAAAAIDSAVDGVLLSETVERAASRTITTTAAAFGGVMVGAPLSPSAATTTSYASEPPPAVQSVTFSPPPISSPPPPYVPISPYPPLSLPYPVAATSPQPSIPTHAAPASSTSSSSSSSSSSPFIIASTATLDTHMETAVLLKSALATITRSNAESEAREAMERESSATQRQAREAALLAGKRAQEAKAEAEAAAVAASIAGEKLAKIEASVLGKEILKAEEAKVAAERMRALNLATLKAETEAEEARAGLEKLKAATEAKIFAAIAQAAGTAAPAAAHTPSSTDATALGEQEQEQQQPYLTSPYSHSHSTFTGSVGMRGVSSTLTPPPVFVPALPVSNSTASLVNRSNLLAQSTYDTADLAASTSASSPTSPSKLLQGLMQVQRMQQSGGRGVSPLKTPSSSVTSLATFSSPYTAAIASASTVLRMGLASPPKPAPLPHSSIFNSSFSSSSTASPHPQQPPHTNTGVTAMSPQNPATTTFAFTLPTDITAVDTPRNILPPTFPAYSPASPLSAAAAAAVPAVAAPASSPQFQRIPQAPSSSPGNATSPLSSRKVGFRIPLGHLGTKPESRVELAGSWDDWKARIPLAFRTGLSGGAGFICRLQIVADANASGRWLEGIEGEPLLLLARGTYAFKYVVDGIWMFDLDVESAMDDNRNVNNVVTL